MPTVHSCESCRDQCGTLPPTSSTHAPTAVTANDAKVARSRLTIMGRFYALATRWLKCVHRIDAGGHFADLSQDGPEALTCHTECQHPYGYPDHHHIRLEEKKFVLAKMNPSSALIANECYGETQNPQHRQVAHRCHPQYHWRRSVIHLLTRQVEPTQTTPDPPPVAEGAIITSSRFAPAPPEAS